MSPRIGLLVHAFGRGQFADAVSQIRAAARAGLDSAWVTELYGLDALTVLTVAGQAAAGIELGTAVVSAFARHPVALAGQALTAQAAVGGRLVLGIGASHRIVVEDVLGLSYDRPLRHLREYLTVLRALTEHGTVAFEGETLRTATRLGPLQVQPREPVPILLAALQPGMVRLAGELADGTVTWMAGPRTLRRIVSSLEAATERAGRAAPRVAAGLPVCVGNEARSRRRIDLLLAAYGRLPVYRALLDEEGVNGPADVALVGDEDQLAEQVDALHRLGVTDFLGHIVGSPDEHQATLEFLGRLARGLSRP